MGTVRCERPGYLRSEPQSPPPTLFKCSYLHPLWLREDLECHHSPQHIDKALGKQSSGGAGSVLVNPPLNIRSYRAAHPSQWLTWAEQAGARAATWA